MELCVWIVNVKLSSRISSVVKYVDKIDMDGRMLLTWRVQCKLDDTEKSVNGGFSPRGISWGLLEGRLSVAVIDAIVRR